ncbi:MAG: ribosome silencing factor [Salinivirgaceae bacterium]|jgi:ribosome-associated protein|nr:ribosome silencing factor [Salinivirgaceae bacterium]
MTENEDQTILKDFIVNAIQDKKGKELIVLDLRDLDQSIADFFIICHGTSNTQVNAIADAVDRETRSELQEHVLHIEGAKNSQWILMDYGSVVVHVFQEEYRHFYNLEDLWADAKKR